MRILIDKTVHSQAKYVWLVEPVGRPSCVGRAHTWEDALKEAQAYATSHPDKGENANVIATSG